MSKGVLLFAHNTPKYNYLKMAVFCANRIKHFLGLPITVITDVESTTNCETSIFDNIIYTIPNKTNKKEKEIWINKDRFKAYELSPYDETILLDVDYVVNSDKLLKTFDIVEDICVHNNTEFVMNPKLPQEMISAYSFKTCWATVVTFKKTLKAKQVFECMEMIQKNYDHYANIYNFVAGTFRNDYAVSIGLQIVNGHLQNPVDFIPWNLYHVGKLTSVYKNNDSTLCDEFLVMHDNWKNGKIKKEYIILKNIDFHVINKDNFVELL